MLAIQLNVDERRQLCGLCHQLHARPLGPALFLIHNQEPVCVPCGREHEPELVALLDLAGAAGRYAGELYASIGLPDGA